METFIIVKYGHPEITIFVAPSGSKIHDEHGETDQTSTFGHIFIGIRGWNPVTEEREAITVGFSPGDSMKTSEDNFHLMITFVIQMHPLYQLDHTIGPLLKILKNSSHYYTHIKQVKNFPPKI